MQPRIPDKIGYQCMITQCCAKLSERAKGNLYYELWKHNETGEWGLALSKNESSGGFSAELILVKDILELLKQLKQQNEAFHATVFKDLFQGKSANNASFLAAVLVNEKVIQLHPMMTRLLQVSLDEQEWQKQLDQYENTYLASSPVEPIVESTQGNKRKSKMANLDQKGTEHADHPI